MKIIKVNPKNPEKEIIEKAVKILELGGVVIYSTETLYGIGANALDTQALYRIFEIKGRDLTKPISVAFRDLKQAKNFVHFSLTAEKLAKKFLPGPLTLILPTKMMFDQVLGGDKMGIRIPDNPIAQALLNEVKFPLTATSANLSGKENPITATIAAEQIGDKADLILDGGKCKYDLPSTVVDVTVNEVKVIREGVINKKELFAEVSKNLYVPYGTLIYGEQYGVCSNIRHTNRNGENKKTNK